MDETHSRDGGGVMNKLCLIIPDWAGPLLLPNKLMVLFFTPNDDVWLFAVEWLDWFDASDTFKTGLPYFDELF